MALKGNAAKLECTARKIEKREAGARISVAREPDAPWIDQIPSLRVDLEVFDGLGERRDGSLPLNKPSLDVGVPEEEQRPIEKMETTGRDTCIEDVLPHGCAKTSVDDDQVLLDMGDRQTFQEPALLRPKKGPSRLEEAKVGLVVRGLIPAQMANGILMVPTYAGDLPLCASVDNLFRRRTVPNQVTAAEDSADGGLVKCPENGVECGEISVNVRDDADAVHSCVRVTPRPAGRLSLLRISLIRALAPREAPLSGRRSWFVGRGLLPP